MAAIRMFLHKVLAASDLGTYLIVGPDAFPQPGPGEEDEALQKLITRLNQPGGANFLCCATGAPIVLLSEGDGENGTQYGSGMCSFDRWNVGLSTDAPNQMIGAVSWWYNALKWSTTPEELQEWCKTLTTHYDTDWADGITALFEIHGDSVYDMTHEEIKGIFVVREELRLDRPMPNFFQRHKSLANQGGTECTWKDQDDVQRFMDVHLHTCCLTGIHQNKQNNNCDRFVNDDPHGRLNNIMSVHLNFAKNTHGAFRTQESFKAFSAKMWPGVELSNLQILRKVFRPLIEQVIHRFVRDNPDTQLPACMAAAR